jgi:uncharacterized membrane protein HdeD (DUF308 family)
MIERLARHWWVLAVRGALALVFGVLAMFWPAITLLVLALVFGAYALADGVLAAVAAFRGGRNYRLPLALEAAFGIAFGVAALVWPRATLLAITILVGIWAIVTGVSAIMAAVRLREELRGEFLYILGGTLSVIFGVLVLFWPASGAVAVAWLIGLYAIVFGILMIGASLRIRRAGGMPSREHAGART